jgi:cystathionine beta-lyase/cystathionine gamma-synthase
MLAIMSQLIGAEGRDLGSAAFAFMRLATTMHDATVAAWKTKYTYYTMRPETYIRQYIDREFLSLSNATATPEYSSGQAAVTAAAVEVLGSVFGYGRAFTDRTYEYRKDIDGSPRSYPSFQDMADEVLSANLLGGIHYRFSLEAGQKQGIEIARNFNAIR